MVARLAQPCAVMQLDIFEHSRDTMLRNDVLGALVRGNVAAAQAAWQQLADECPLDTGLHPLTVLISALQRRTSAAFADHDAASDARLRLLDETQPAAWSLFGQGEGDAWLLPLWREVAQRAASLAFRADRNDDHAAPLWLRAGDWANAADAVKGIESWRRIPAPLAWMTEARHRLAGLRGNGDKQDGSWALLAELAWLAPARFGALAKALADPVLDKLLRKFGADFEGECSSDDLAWFPAWALTEEAGLARWLGLARPSLQTGPERAMRLMLDLLSLERQGRHHDLVTRRKQLRDLNASIFSAYIRTR